MNEDPSAKATFSIISRGDRVGPDLREPWYLTDIAPRFAAWAHQRYYLIDSAGLIVAMFKDEKIARHVVELVNASQQPRTIGPT